MDPEDLSGAWVQRDKPGSWVHWSGFWSLGSAVVDRLQNQGLHKGAWNQSLSAGLDPRSEGVTMAQRSTGIGAGGD